MQVNNDFFCPLIDLINHWLSIFFLTVGVDYSFDSSPTDAEENGAYSKTHHHPVYLEYKGLQLMGPRFVF